MKVTEMDKERQRWLRDGGECGKDGEKVRRVEKWEGLYVGRKEHNTAENFRSPAA
jgi:hypothetical protein